MNLLPTHRQGEIIPWLARYPARQLYRQGLLDLSDKTFSLFHRRREAQMIIQRVIRAEWREVDDLPASARHDGGFGHTDKK